MSKEEEGICMYKDPNQAVEDRVRDLLSRMTLKEKAAQMTTIEKPVAHPSTIKDLSIGGVYIAPESSYPEKHESPADWANTVDTSQRAALSSRLGIPIIYASDAVHGQCNVYGATIFPHNVGLGATRDRDLVQRIGAATALEVRASGIHYTYGPVVAVIKDPRWGRCYESFSEDTELVRSMTSIVSGLQGVPPGGHLNGYPYVAGRLGGMETILVNLTEQTIVTVLLLQLHDGHGTGFRYWNLVEHGASSYPGKDDVLWKGIRRVKLCWALMSTLTDRSLQIQEPLVWSQNCWRKGCIVFAWCRMKGGGIADVLFGGFRIPRLDPGDLVQKGGSIALELWGFRPMIRVSLVSVENEQENNSSV
ncbi:hypothetical protein HHK36_032932 [Tetracentron sinense]|uniref:Glycoside hydrolase family 3 N-terminal domain-containing protein n=1 Tax=Tetracentron sinense TaxID=13715 RepID=A0A834Y629_TETSI|nr:hypothetical protein HHK36_032932 [Tetracentron sinense]